MIVNMDETPVWADMPHAISIDQRDVISSNLKLLVLRKTDLQCV